MDFNYIQNYYKVPAECGREIIFQGKRKGVIVESQGHYIGVNFNDKKPGIIETLHPTWEIEYRGLTKIRKMTKSQKRYQEYLNADYYNGTFAEWLGIV